MANFDGKVVYSIEGDDTHGKKALDDFEGHAKGKGGAFEQIWTGAARRVGEALTNMAQQGIQAVGQFVSQGIAYNAELETLLTNFTTLMGGDAAGADALVDNIRELAKVTPLATDGLSKNAQTLMGYGIASENVVDTLQMLGDAAMGDQNKLDALTLAYSQTQATGKLMGQDALQMVNAGIPIYSLLGDMMGVTAGEAKKMGEAGEISAEMVTEALKAATSEGGLYYGAMAKTAETLTGKVSTLEDTYKEFSGEVTEALTPALMELIDIVSENVLGTEDMKESIGDLFSAVAEIATTALPPLIDLLMLLLPIILDLLEALLPIIGIVLDIITTAIKPVMEALGPLIELIATILQPVIEVLGAVISSVFEGIGKDVGRIVGGITYCLRNIIDFIKNVFTGNWKGAWENVKNIFRSIVDSLATIFKWPINAIIDGINGFLRGLNNIKIPDWVPGFGGRSFNISLIPRLKKGLDFVPQDMMPAFLDYGERVLTREENAAYNALGGLGGIEKMLSSGLMAGRGSSPIQISVPLYLDGREVARATAWYTGEQLSWEEI